MTRLCIGALWQVAVGCFRSRPLRILGSIRLRNANENLKVLIPVHGEHGCVGHLLRSAKGFRACDVNDKEIGTFPTTDAAACRFVGARDRSALGPPDHIVTEEDNLSHF